ncbi:hypothetical protein GGR52DRAFT_507931 [Hypoxylon sp. FL1284]|nr:hypothetical protein GGR52DRAFT_507931 [Hypoxylon sp. FL1284]
MAERNPEGRKAIKTSRLFMMTCFLLVRVLVRGHQKQSDLLPDISRRCNRTRETSCGWSGAGRLGRLDRGPLNDDRFWGMRRRALDTTKSKYAGMTVYRRDSYYSCP